MHGGTTRSLHRLPTVTGICLPLPARLDGSRLTAGARCARPDNGGKIRGLRRLLLAVFPICGLVNPAAASETIALDKDHLVIRFEVAGPWSWRIEGRFNEAHGQLALDASELEKSSLKVVVRTASIDTGSAPRDNSLRSTDFFDVARHPFMIFESTKVDIVDHNAGIISGDLSLLGVSRPIRLSFEVSTPQPAGSPQAAVPLMNFRARGVLHRSEWGMTALIPVISDQVHLEIRADIAGSWRRSNADPRRIACQSAPPPAASPVHNECRHSAATMPAEDGRSRGDDVK